MSTPTILGGLGYKICWDHKKPWKAEGTKFYSTMSTMSETKSELAKRTTQPSKNISLLHGTLWVQ